LVNIPLDYSHFGYTKKTDPKRKRKKTLESSTSAGCGSFSMVRQSVLLGDFVVIATVAIIHRKIETKFWLKAKDESNNSKNPFKIYIWLTK